ncbi:MAG: hypothetical protein HYT40_03410 [Candidatus Sungbacteria bacterium]|uniref:Uncharacterized protein n=1 Tax=Candidatus Sungiibacteriota bacterium TaxID=2750080 RepID=A0A931WPN7_9BACT|nr:hypothetical protein [Candidatus Sungbacteria bacterium]
MTAKNQKLKIKNQNFGRRFQRYIHFNFCPAIVRERSERLPVAKIPLYPARQSENTSSSFTDSAGLQTLTLLRSGYVRDILNFVFAPRAQGITLLLVILVLSVLMTISLGIFNVLFTELRISGELARSYRALYASDQALEVILYRDRVRRDICIPNPPSDNVNPCPGDPGPPTYQPGIYTDRLSGGCAVNPNSQVVNVYTYKYDGKTRIKSIGWSDCVDDFKTVKRAFQIIY